MNYRLGIDLGGTKILMLLVNEQEEIVGEEKVYTRASDGPERIISYLLTAADNFMVKNNIPPQNLEGIGVCVAGFYHYPSGKMISSPNLPNWDDFPLKNKLEEGFSCPVLVENDANAAAFGEYTWGAGKGKRNVFLFTLGTGIGGGIVNDGQIYRGEGGFAGEIGHLPLIPGGELCGCGKRGCLETISSGRAIEREAQEILSSPFPTVLKDLTNEVEIKASHVFNAAEMGDEEAKKIINRAAYYLGLGLTSAVNLINPDIIIAAGGLSQNKRTFWEKVLSYIENHAVYASVRNLDLIPAALGEAAGAKGMVALLEGKNHIKK